MNFQKKQGIFNKICREIKSLKIQGAENIAKKAFYAYKLIPNKMSKKKLLNLRPTSPMLLNVLKMADKISYNELIKKLNENQKKINKHVFKLIQDNSITFTHCHSSTIVKALIYARKKGKKFEVYNAETRPLYQGRKTAKELKRSRIRVTMFADPALKIALTKEQDKEEKTKPANLVLLGADAITKNKAINKVGSGMISEIAKDNKIPVYLIADSLKFANKKINFEQRSPREIWINKKINIKNPAFESIPKEHITGIISELGILKYIDFLRKVRGL